MATNNSNSLPVIPLSPIVQSYILSSSAYSQATEKLEEAKQSEPPLSVGALRRLIENVRVEENRLESLSRKIESVEGATLFFWDADTLARQITIINSLLFNNVVLDKKTLSQEHSTGLSRFIDFHNYLSHNMAHQLIYWVELSKPDNQTVVVPPIHPKDNLTTHLIRVAYLLLHSYRDFSGFAAVMKAFSLPQVRRLNNIPPSSQQMFNEMSLIISPANNYQAYHHSLYNKLELHMAKNNVRIAIPWVQPHLIMIQNTAAADVPVPSHYTELSILELCQGHFSTSLDINNRSKSVQPVCLDGTMIMPVSNLNELGTGNELMHHWLVSRVYLDNEQLMYESVHVQPWGLGETIVLPSAQVPSDVIHHVSKASCSESSQQKLEPAASELASNISEENWEGYESNGEDSEVWRGYPGPHSDEEEEAEDEIWKGYPGPNSSSSTAASPRRTPSATSEEWKGYHATKMEADWQRESVLKIKQCEWQGYNLEAYNSNKYGKIVRKRSI
ncbi:hypothetical protein BY458DRAFT_584856 [Sporodiniella umbellata]|nr:hypothetical protein BY458DRAFT_584856 [Sporodiniella umbellata]